MFLHRTAPQVAGVTPWRWLSSRQAPAPSDTLEPIEPSANSDRRNHIVLSDIFAPRKPEWNRRLAAGGCVAGLSGTGVLLANNIELWANFDTLGVTAASIGALMIAAAKPRARGAMESESAGVFMNTGSDSKQSDESQFKFIRLNSSYDHAVAACASASTGGGTDILPTQVEGVLTAAERDECVTKEAAIAARAEELEVLATEKLKAGMSARHVREELVPRVFVLTFTDPAEETNMKGRGQTKRTPDSAVREFGAAVSLVLGIVGPKDEVIIRLTSPGGAVSTYGHLSAHVLRFRKARVRTTVCVDTVAASGGYMVACCADHVVASPFAFLGSIGVVAGMPNFHRLMDKHELDYLLMTAGKYKRTVHPLTKITDEGVAKMNEQLESIHEAFKHHVGAHRAAVDSEVVGTGESWLATHSIEHGLVDQLATSEEYVRSKFDDFVVLDVSKINKPKNPLQQFFEKTASWVEGLPLLRGVRDTVALLQHGGELGRGAHPGELGRLEQKFESHKIGAIDRF